MDGLFGFINSFKNPSKEDFFKSGYLNSEYFVEAGDYLTLVGWKWMPSINKKYQKSLPNPYKQYLQTEGRSDYRIKDLMRANLRKTTDEQGWQVFEEYPQQTHYVAFLLKDFIFDPYLSSFICVTSQSRQYTISITLDDYYHCPRMWLTGTDEDGKPLTPQQIFEDITSEHQNETVTPEEHPHLGLTIHPCKHSERLREFVQYAAKNGVEYKPYAALLIFLKFMQSIMPTIEYDSAIEIHLNNPKK